MKRKLERYRSLTALSALLLAIAILLADAPLAWGGDGEVTILTITRLASQLSPIAEKVNRETVFMGGLAHASGVIRQIREEDPNALLIVGGESVFGPMWRYFNGQPEFSALSTMGVQAATIGKHELDYGWSHLERALPHISFPLLLSNATISDDSALPFKKDIVVPCGEMRVGFFALLSPTLFSTTQKPVKELQIDGDVRGVAKAMVKGLKLQGADVIVMISALTEAENNDLASNVAGIHAIFGRGTQSRESMKPHFVTGPDGWLTALVWGGTRCRFVGKLQIRTKDGRISEKDVSWQLMHVLASKVQADDTVSAIALESGTKLNAQLEKVIGYFEEPVNTRRGNVRSREMPMGNFAADALRAVGGADVGLINGGAIRGNKVYPIGEFSEKTLFENFPFGNDIEVIPVKGAALRQAMELSASALIVKDDAHDVAFRVPDGGFLQISGLRVVYDTSGAPTTFKEDGTIDQWGTRLLSVSVEKDGVWHPLDDEADYSVALSSYLADGGDRYFVLKGASARRKTGFNDIEALLAYLKKFPNGRLHLSTNGRITFQTHDKAKNDKGAEQNGAQQKQ